MEQRIVLGDRHADGLAQRRVGIGERGLLRRGVDDAGVEEGGFAIDDGGGAGPAAVGVGTAGGGCERDGLAMPMDHVRRGGVGPELYRGDRLVVVLQEHVVAALPVDGAAGIVHPAMGGEQVVLRTHGVACDGGVGAIERAGACG